MRILILSFVLSTTVFAKNIILIPGAASSGSKIYIKYTSAILGLLHQTEYFGHLKNFLSKEHTVYICPKIEDNDTRSLADRTVDCFDFINEKKLCGNLTLIGHSMGGLIARKLASDYLPKKCISKVLTISTPHRGTYLADYAILPEYENTFVHKTAKILKFTPEHKKYINELSVLGGDRDNFKNIIDNPNVKYFSISNFQTTFLNFPLYLTQESIEELIKRYSPTESIKNDGVVPTYSMIHGKHLGEIKADHLESACIFTGRITPGCTRLKQILTDFLSWL